MTTEESQMLANTRRKLADLEEMIRESKKNASTGQATELRSLSRLANQLREEISRYSAHAVDSSADS